MLPATEIVRKERGCVFDIRVCVCSVIYIHTTTLVTLYMGDRQCRQDVRIYLSWPETCGRTLIHQDGWNNRPILPQVSSASVYAFHSFAPRSHPCVSVSIVTEVARMFGCIILYWKYAAKVGDITNHQPATDSTLRGLTVEWKQTWSDECQSPPANRISKNWVIGRGLSSSTISGTRPARQYLCTSNILAHGGRFAYR